MLSDLLQTIYSYLATSALPMIYRLAPFLILLSALYFVAAGVEATDAEKKPVNVKQPKITNIVYFDIAHGEQKLGRSASHRAVRTQALS